MRKSLFALSAAAAWLSGCKPFTIEGELAKAPAADRQALDAILESNGLKLAQLTPVGAGVAPPVGGVVAGIAGAVVAVPTAAALVRATPYLLGRQPAGADQPGTLPRPGVGSPP